MIAIYKRNDIHNCSKPPIKKDNLFNQSLIHENNITAYLFRFKFHDFKRNLA